MDSIERRRSVRASDTPGTLIVQIDGLGLAVLQRAIDGGQLPFVAGLLRRGEVTITPWFTMLPPTTPASQAGIMHGHNDDIPGFRWYEKSGGRLLVANHSGDADEMVRRQSDGHGLLAPDGVSIGNLMTGDARRTYLTMATVAEEPRAPGTIIRLRTFLLSPVNAARVVLAMAREFTAELYQGWRQDRRDVQPRMHRGFDSATERAFLNGAVRILSSELVIAEMRTGTPLIYVDFTGYDSVAHHSGPERPESLDALRSIDHELGRIAAAMPRAARPYRLVVLSDHGQSLGEPFSQRYGESLERFVARGMAGDPSVRSSTETEHNHGVALIRREIMALVGIGRTLVAAAGAIGQRIAGIMSDAQDKADLVVCASGNLAHLYFPTHPGRMTLDEIEARHPRLVAHLVDHPAISCVLGRSSDGPLAIGRDGRHHLDANEVEGQDPLVSFGPLAAASLRRLDGFSNAGDIVLLGTMDPATEQVVSFEDLVGCHGGLGGAQSEPFLLHPVAWKARAERLVGAPSVNAQLRTWLGELENVQA
ncbi:MAG: phage holin family protein [Candidatus Limnocylindrales bacterium]